MELETFLKRLEEVKENIKGNPHRKPNVVIILDEKEVDLDLVLSAVTCSNDVCGCPNDLVLEIKVDRGHEKAKAE